MIKTFTPNDVIRYIYNETPEEESEQIAYTLLTDSQLQAFYDEMLALKKDLNKTDIGPSERVIQNILAYSRDFDLHPVK
jgi:hypothetical protein